MKHLSKIFAVIIAMALAVSPVLADSFIVNGVPSDTPAIDVTNTYVAPNDGPVTDDEFIDFDDLNAPPYFSQQVPLTNEYAGQGVIFQGLGEVLHMDGNFGITNFSEPNFLAFNTGVGANPPETMLFDPVITDISILAGHSSSGTITMTAYNVGGGVIGSTSLTGTSALQTMSLSGMTGCASVVLNFTGTVCCFDDLWFDSGAGAPVTLTLYPTTTTVPETGGPVVYDASLVSTIPLSMTGLRYQTFATLPNSQVYGPIDNIPFTLTPFMNVTIYNMSINVPGTAPAGNYIFEAKAGVPNNPPMQVTDSFPFTKTAGGGFYEDFQDGQAQNFSWYHEGGGSHTISDGYAKVYQMTGSGWGSGVYAATSYGDATTSTIFQYRDGIYSRGMLFRGDGPKDADFSGYGFWIAHSLDAFSIWKYVGGVELNVYPWTTSTLINEGVGAMNSLTLVADGSTFDMYLNGSYLGSVSDTDFSSGYSGIVTYGSEVWFDAVGCTPGINPPSADAMVQGEVLAGNYDDMGRPTDRVYPSTGAVVFDRSEEIRAALAEYEFNPEEWIGSNSFGVASNGEASLSVPTEFALENAYPNPFNPSTSFSVTLPEAAELTVNVYNVAGQLVATVANGTYTAGNHAMTFDASNLASGLYFIRATVPGQMDQTQKVMLVR